MNGLNKQIGQRVRAQREYLGITRENFCNYVSISPQFLSEIERGVKGVSAETLCKLCEGLGISADYILMGKEVPQDIPTITKTLATLDKKYVPLAEELLRAFFKTIQIKERTL